MKDRTGGYTVAFVIIAMVMLASPLLPIFTRAPQVVVESPTMARA